MHTDPMSDPPTTLRQPGAGVSDDLPTIGMPTIGAPGPYPPPGPVHPGTYPTGPTGGLPPIGPPRSGGRGPIVVVAIASIASLIAVCALVVVLVTGGDGKSVAADDASVHTPTTPVPAVPTPSPVAPAPVPVLTDPPTPALPATNLPTPTASPVAGSGSAPGPVAVPAPATPPAGSASLYGSYVAMLWSTEASVSPAEIEANRSQQGNRYGVPTTVVYGNDYLSLRDGTVAVVYAGGFANSRDAALWCKDQGVTDWHDCFGVVLDNTHDWQDKGNNQRTYINQL